MGRHATRKPKEHKAPETIHAKWRGEVAELGEDPDELVRQVTGRARDRTPQVSDQTVRALFDLLAGPDGLTAQVPPQTQDLDHGATWSTSTPRSTSSSSTSR